MLKKYKAPPITVCGVKDIRNQLVSRITSEKDSDQDQHQKTITYDHKKIQTIINAIKNI